MQKINIVCVGKIKEAFYRQAAEEYLKRLSRFASVTVKELPEGKSPADEAPSVLKACRGKVIALCIEGVKFSIKEYTDRGEEATFVIGSSCGLADAVKNTAHLKLSFSDMTFRTSLCASYSWNSFTARL